MITDQSRPEIREWRSLHYASKFFGRSYKTIKLWCRDGTFSEAGVPIYRDKSGRVWVFIPSHGEVNHN